MARTSGLTNETALLFPKDFGDGFTRPKMGWSAFGPRHLNGLGGDCIGSNIWYGIPKNVRFFVERLCTYYESERAREQLSESQFGGLSLAYWEHNNIAMCGEFCTGNRSTHFFESNDLELNAASEEITFLLSADNDHDAIDILRNRVDGFALDVKTRLSLAHFMTARVWNYDIELPDFTQSNKAELLKILTTISS